MDSIQIWCKLAVVVQNKTAVFYAKKYGSNFYKFSVKLLVI